MVNKPIKENKPASNEIGTASKLDALATLGTPLPVPPILLANNIKIDVVSIPCLFACIAFVPWSRLTFITKRFQARRAHTSHHITITKLIHN